MNTDEHETLEDLYDRNFVPALTVMMRKECFQGTGSFDESQISTDDYDYWLRLSLTYKFKYMAEPLARWNLSPKSLSKNTAKSFEGKWKILNKPEYHHLPWMKRVKRLSKMCLEYAGRFEEDKDYLSAAKLYGLALCVLPFVGLYIWPSETKRMRFSMPYRILKFYGMAVICLFKFFSTSKKETYA